MSQLSHISSNIDRVRAEIAAAAERVGRDPQAVTLIAVTKTYPVEYITAALHAGVTDAGENRVQEALPKIEAMSNDATLSPLRWHLIGHLQSNKAKAAVQNFDLIHSVDSVKLALQINRHAANEDRLMPILIQINISGEESKSGVEPGDALATVQEVLNSCSNITIKGFMTMAPFESPEAARPHFKALRELRDHMVKEINHLRFDPSELSMGMSNDYIVAVEEGSTLVRVGSALFGERKYNK